MLQLGLLAMASMASMEIHVHPSRGGDEGSGAADDPLRSLHAARDAVRRLARVGAGGATVVLHSGRHSPLLLSAELDSGSADFPIRYVAAPGAAPTISAGVPVPSTAWTKWGGEHPAPILTADLAALGLSDFGSLPVNGNDQEGCDQLVLRKTELFHHDSEMVLARFPNVAADGRWEFLNADPNGGMLAGFAYSGCDYGGHNCSAERVERLKRWTEEGAAEGGVALHGYWVRDWADSIERVQQIVVTNGTAVITLPKVMQERADGRNHNNVVDGSARFFGLNILSELGTLCPSPAPGPCRPSLHDESVRCWQTARTSTTSHRKARSSTGRPCRWRSGVRRRWCPCRMSPCAWTASATSRWKG